MERQSEYFAGLSVDSQRHEQKVLASGLSIDPYAIDDWYWTEVPETVPDTQWSDMMVYMKATPSPYTREEIKVIAYMYMTGSWVLLL